MATLFIFRFQVALVEKSIPVESAAEKMPRKSALLRQLKTVEVERAEVLRPKKRDISSGECYDWDSGYFCIFFLIFTGTYIFCPYVDM